MAEKRVIELEVKTDSVKSLKAQLREAQADVAALSEKFGATSKEAINAAKRAAELKDAIGDAKALTDAFNPDAKFNALSSSIGGVLNGFQAYQGALGLIGVEGKAIEETLLKVQSAMAVSQGIQGLLEAKDSFKQLGAVAMDALKGIRTGLLLTGIGAFIVALGVVVAYWDDIKKAVGGVSEEEKKLAEFRRKHEAERRDFVAKESAGFAMALSQLKATNEGSKERSKLISEINQKYGTTLKNLSDEKAFQQQINDELKNYLAYQTAKFKLQSNEEAIVNNLKTQSRLRQEIAQAEKDLTKAIQEGAGKTRRTLEDGVLTTVYVNEQASIAAEQAGKKIRENEKALADAERRFENYGKAALKAGSEISKLTDNGKKYSEQNKEVVKTTKEVVKTTKEVDQAATKANEDRISKGDAQYALELSLMKDSKAKEKQELINSYDEKFAIADGNAELEKQLKEQLKIDLGVIDKKYADAELAKIEAANQKKLASDKGFLEARITQNENDFQAKLELLELNKQAELSNKELTEGEKTAIEAKYAKQREELSKQEADKKAENQLKALNSAKQSLQGIADLASLFAGKSKKEQEKAFKVQKAVNIAQATIDTFTSAQAAYKSVVGIPVVGPGLAIAAAAAAIAAGLANIKKISAAKFEGGGTPDSSTPPAPNVSGGTVAPAFNIVGNAQAQNPLAGLGQQPIKAYVVSGEVTTAQSLDRQKVYSATFG